MARRRSSRRQWSCDGAFARGAIRRTGNRWQVERLPGADAGEHQARAYRASKRTGRGAGLGLAMGSRLCVESAGGGDWTKSADLWASGGRRLAWLCRSRRAARLRLRDESNGIGRADRWTRGNSLQHDLRRALSFDIKTIRRVFARVVCPPFLGTQMPADLYSAQRSFRKCAIEVR